MELTAWNENLDVKYEERSNFDGASHCSYDSWNPVCPNFMNGALAMTSLYEGGTGSPTRTEFASPSPFLPDPMDQGTTDSIQLTELTPVKNVSTHPSNPHQSDNFSVMELDSNVGPWAVKDLNNTTQFCSTPVSNNYPSSEFEYLDESLFQESCYPDNNGKYSNTINNNNNNDNNNNSSSIRTFSQDSYDPTPFPEEHKDIMSYMNPDILPKVETMTFPDNTPGFPDPQLLEFQEFESQYLQNTSPTSFASGYSSYGSPYYDNSNLNDLEMSHSDFPDPETGSIPSPGSCSPCKDPDYQTSSDRLGEMFWLKVIKVGKNNRPRGPRCWEFLLRLLKDSSSNPSLVKWEDKSIGSFRLVEKDRIAAIWGKRQSKKKAKSIKYESFARILRYHYKNGKGMVLPVSEKHLVYKFSREVMSDYNAGKIL